MSITKTLEEPVNLLLENNVKWRQCSVVMVNLNKSVPRCFSETVPLFMF